MSIGRAIGWLAEQDPDRVAVSAGEVVLTRRELDLAANRLARGYAELGVEPDDLVTVMLPNTAEMVVACVAIWKLGATPAPLSPLLPAAEQRAILELTSPALVIGPSRLESDIPCVAVGSDIGRAFSGAPLPDRAARCWKAPTSSGSTGQPKLVLSASPATVDPTVQPVSYIPLDAVQLVVGPLHHAAPFVYAFRGLMTGHHLVLLDRPGPTEVLAAIERYRVTWAVLVPTMMHRIWRLGPEIRGGFDLSTLSELLHLGAPCAIWLKRAWIDWLGPDRITEVYAGTESAGVTTISGRDWLVRPGSVGRPAPGHRFRILDDRGEDVVPGEIGEIHMLPPRGPGSTYRYRGAEPQLTADGWDSLGDLGWLDEAGWLYLADRRTDLILCGGENVYPAEVESVLDSHPVVRSSAVVGLPDDDLGQRVHAVVDTGGVPITPQELVDWVADRLQRIKVPRSIDVIDELLRADTGKTRRPEIRARVLAGAFRVDQR